MYVLVYTLVSHRNAELLRKSFLYGPLYVVVLYVIINFVVLPLSRVNAHPTLAHPDWIILSVIAHIVFGVVCVLFARRALRPG